MTLCVVILLSRHPRRKFVIVRKRHWKLIHTTLGECAIGVIHFVTAIGLNVSGRQDIRKREVNIQKSR
jgi:hypothetical protein